MFFYPEKADGVWGDALRAGKAERDSQLGELDVMVGVSLAIGDDVEERLNWAKPHLALYIGGMGAKGRNFYHNLATRYGFGDVADHIQDLFLSGRKAEAIAAVPTIWSARSTSSARAASSRSASRHFAEAGVTTLLATPVTTDGAEYVRYVEELQQLLP